MSEAAKGVAAMVTACVIWGLSPIFYAQVAHVPPLEVLSHRTLWSLVFFAGWLGWQRRAREAVRLATRPRALLVCAVASLAISGNWFFFILSTQIDRVTESSLGYYIFPLVAVLLGRFVLGERLSPLRWLAVGIASGGVAALAIGIGALPWLSLALALTFGTYGLVKRWIAAGPLLSVTVEVGLLAPVAAVFLWLAGEGHFGDPVTAVYLVLSGPATAAPLVLFSYATKRVRLATIGLVQYLNPTLQFGCAMLFFGEVLTVWHAMAFPAIWIALVLYSAESLRSERASRRAATIASTSGTRAT